MKINSRRVKKFAIITALLLVMGIVSHHFFDPKSSLIYKVVPAKYTVSDNENESQTVHFDTKTIRTIPDESIVHNYEAFLNKKPDEIDWNKLAFAFYATRPDQLLPVLVNVRQLRKLHSKAKIEIMCSFNVHESKKKVYKKIKLQATIDALTKKYDANINVVHRVKSKFRSDDSTWDDSFTKFHAFNLVEYDRVIYLDADAIIQKNMDHLFFLPPCLLATPLNYIEWSTPPNPLIVTKENKDTVFEIMGELPPTPQQFAKSIDDLHRNVIEKESKFDSKYIWSLYESLPTMDKTLDKYPKSFLGSYVMIIMPDSVFFEILMNAVENKTEREYDMEIINNLFKPQDLRSNNYFSRSKTYTRQDSKNLWLHDSIIPSLFILPHQPFALLSGGYKHSLIRHRGYLTLPSDLHYFENAYPALNIQRTLAKTEDGITGEEMYKGIPYWDWAWRLEDKDHLELDHFGWNNKDIRKSAYSIHWSDWPLPKPWKISGHGQQDEIYHGAIGSCRASSEEILQMAYGEGELSTPFQNELKYEYEMCEDGMNVWKSVYDDYAEILSDISKEFGKSNDNSKESNEEDIFDRIL